MTDFRTDAAPDLNFRDAIGTRVFYTSNGKRIDVQLRWLDDTSLEYAVAPRTVYETNASHAARCWLKARLPLDRAMAWTRERRMSAKRVWITTNVNPDDEYHQSCSHRIVFKSPDHAFEFRLRWT